MGDEATTIDGHGEDSMDIRRATPDDVGAILQLGRRSLGWTGDEDDARLFAWKHFDNPFGVSPMWLAFVDGRLAGFRTFLRWEFVDERGARFHAVRAVDTATDPDFRGQGVFTALTLGALGELEADGVDFVFNTPNDQSRPGYLKMGWIEVGRLPVTIRPANLRSLPRLVRARTPADRGAVASTVGAPADEVFADRTALEAILRTAAPRSGLSTARSPDFFQWRYGLSSLHYRVVTPPDGLDRGFAVFHLRRRGPAVEAVIGDVLTPRGESSTARHLLARVARASDADYLIRLERRLVGRDGFVGVPRTGPTLTVRRVRTQPPTDLSAWRLEMGDIELF